VTELWYVPSPAPTTIVEFTPGLGTTLNSPLNALLRNGTNNVTLNLVTKAPLDLNWTIMSVGIMGAFPFAASCVTCQELIFVSVCCCRSESGASGIMFTLRLSQSAPRNASWTLLVTIPCGVSASFNSSMTMQSPVLQLPSSCSEQIASLLLVSGGGATFAPPYHNPTVPLGYAWGTAAYAFSVFREDSAYAGSFNLSMTVAPSNDTSWRASVRGGGLLPRSLDSSSAPSLTVVRFNVSTAVAIDNSSLVQWASGDNCVNVPSSSGVYGTIGVPSDFIEPSSRMNAVVWSGLDGHLYFFGTETSSCNVRSLFIPRIQLHCLLWI
jgi:hypothetical protein